ncbi:MAG: Cof-type HAD-IIB family hydrolase [Rhizomicrobium sp.]
MMPPPNIALLLSDVDGTLVTQEKVLTPRARQAVIRLQEKNIRFAITSGRPPRGMAMFVDPLGIVEPIAGFNGGAYVTPDLRLLESQALSGKAAGTAVELLHAHGLDAWLYTADAWYVRDPEAPHVARETATVAFAPKVAKSFDDFYASAVKIVGVGDDFPRVRQADAEIGRALDGAASVSRSQPYYIDITNPAANKAAVVRYHAGRLDIAASRIATIGDMPNDVFMFRASGFSIAMGNASSEVQAQATAVTDSCDGDGFAKAVERYLLGDS